MAVNSPCIDVCNLDGKTRLCVGCFRTLEEIRGWMKMTDHRRHQLISDRSRRQAKLMRERWTIEGRLSGDNISNNPPSYAPVSVLSA
ncbi:DUF1289 domain-containing protein [Trinickia violacea]|uniref:DUF1289 domain-containing protein n=1 Tax=Trinickia violacea TaxID=2571746 RepID=A0A4V1EGX4_9BURK|nr:DUF1289 domain-containing protein [Trinickia violacea]